MCITDNVDEALAEALFCFKFVQSYEYAQDFRGVSGVLDCAMTRAPNNNGYGMDL